MTILFQYTRLQTRLDMAVSLNDTYSTCLQHVQIDRSVETIFVFLLRFQISISTGQVNNHQIPDGPYFRGDFWLRSSERAISHMQEQGIDK